MEPGPRRPRTSRPPVSAFLRDPSSGRVYRRGKLIGKGAFSRCYKLMDMSTSAVFALKVVPRAGGAAGRLRPRGKVDREIALHSRLKHRNIVALHGHFADRENVYMVLEYCSRQSLAHVLEARQTLTEPEVRYYLRGLVSGLRYLHQRRIVHRDLKPSNFFLNKNMVVKIGDLGLAARVGPGGHCHRVLCGTPNFLAPEVISRNGHSCQSDLWALGCIMYTVLTGTPPFMVAPLSEMYQNIRDGRYPEPAHLSPNARRLIARLLAPNPVERPSLDHLLQDDFFTQGFTPDRLPARSCYSPPFFTVPQPLGRLFRKVGRLLLPQCRPLCDPPTCSTASGPGEGGSDPDPMEWGSEVRAPGRGGWRLVEHILTAGLRGGESRGGLPSERMEPLTYLWALVGARASPHPCFFPRPPCWTQGLPTWRSPSTCSPTGPSGATQRVSGHSILGAAGGDRVCYVPGRGKLETFTPRDVPRPLAAKLAVLRLFTCCLRRRVRQEGSRPSPPPAAPNLCLLRFLVSERALLLLFSDGTVQVSAGVPWAHLVLSGGGGKELQLTVWEDGQPRTSYPRGALQSPGCAPQARPRLVHALHMLQSI
uniref:Serine/threonine-protein kinase PLK n=1 Tax=Canis lupus dingo TaxID=286419 RepID=A0A8C0R2X5_CANLU